MMPRWPERRTFVTHRAIYPVYTPKVSDFMVDVVIDHPRSNSGLGEFFLMTSSLMTYCNCTFIDATLMIYDMDTLSYSSLSRALVLHKY